MNVIICLFWIENTNEFDLIGGLNGNARSRNRWMWVCW